MYNIKTILEDFEGEREEKPKLFLPKIGRASGWI
jgi:hypothetical protein